MNQQPLSSAMIEHRVCSLLLVAHQGALLGGPRGDSFSVIVLVKDFGDRHPRQFSSIQRWEQRAVET